MNIKQIYKKYQTPQNLQKHLLRVGALASILTDNWLGPKIHKAAIIQAALLHDLAKPMNFNLHKQAQFGMSPADIKKLEKLQSYLRNKFGTDEHLAAIKITQSLKCPPNTVRIISNLDWENIPRLRKNNDFESLIAVYCDMRIGPKGILSLEERLADLKKRVGSKNLKKHLKNGQALEKLIAKQVPISPHSITNGQLNLLFDKLLKTRLNKQFWARSKNKAEKYSRVIP